VAPPLLEPQVASVLTFLVAVEEGAVEVLVEVNVVRTELVDEERMEEEERVDEVEEERTDEVEVRCTTGDDNMLANLVSF
jgi:hypothetical protein